MKQISNLIVTAETKKTARTCVYCGCEEPTTVDHIPPKLFFERPYPPNLLTVPTCLKCNKSFQGDDEYTRAITCIDMRSAKHPTVQLKMPTVLRSFQKAEAVGFAKYLRTQMTDSAILGPDEKPMAQAVDADRARLNATGERIVRGLYFVEAGRPLPPGTPIRISCRPGVSSSEPAVMQFARMHAAELDCRDGVVGDAFSYIALFHPQFSAWFLLLYGHFAWLATIGGFE
jgi:hypothetical protein